MKTRSKRTSSVFGIRFGEDTSRVVSIISLMTSILSMMLSVYFAFVLLSAFASFDDVGGYEDVAPYILYSVAFISFVMASIVSLFVFNHTRKSMNI